MADKLHIMGGARGISSSLVLLCLLTWRCCLGVKTGPFGGCQYVTVAETTSFPIAGCYRKATNLDHGDGDGFSYANYKGKVAEGMANQPMVLWKSHVGTDESRSPWSIGENGENGEPPSMMCTSRMEGWECVDGATFEELVTCGCSASEQEASELDHAAWIDAQGGSISRGRGSGGGSSSDRRNNMRRRDSRDIFHGAPLVASARGAAGVSRVLSTGEFHSFWMWVIIAGGIAGLIVLCCVGWYIRNPFFCQKAPPADPDAQAEDAAPQAPKTAFQPWGASAPPK